MRFSKNYVKHNNNKLLRWRIIWVGRILTKLAEFWEVIGRGTLKNFGTVLNTWLRPNLLIVDMTRLTDFENREIFFRKCAKIFAKFLRFSSFAIFVGNPSHCTGQPPARLAIEMRNLVVRQQVFRSNGIPRNNFAGIRNSVT